MGGRSRFDLSAFVMDYTNLQVQTPIGIGVFDIRNAAAATIRGLEVENTSRWGRGIEAGGHVTWLDATYDQYIAVDNSGAIGDVAGNRLNNAPEWAGRFWIEWSGDIGRSGRLSIAADATAQSTVYYTRSTTASSDRGRMASSAPASNTDPAIVGGLSPRTPETSRTRTTSRRPSGRRPRRLADVLDPRASSLLISPYGDKTVTPPRDLVCSYHGLLGLELEPATLRLTG